MSKHTGTTAIFGEALVDDFGTEQIIGGAPFNFARHLAGFAAPTLMITRIGEDALGSAIRSEFARFGMSQDALQCDARQPTGRVIVERCADSHRFTILPDQAYDYIDAAPALAALARHAPSTLYFGTMAQRAETSRSTLEQLLSASDATLFLDLNMREGQVSEQTIHASMQRADIVKVNEDELHELLARYAHGRMGKSEAGSAGLVAGCRFLLQTFSLEAIVVTLGPRGAIHVAADGTQIVSRNGGPAVEVRDTVGAGDAFSAVFVLGRLLGWPQAQTLARANQFAAAVCTIPGAVPADLAFYTPWIEAWNIVS